MSPSALCKRRFQPTILLHSEAPSLCRAVCVESLIRRQVVGCRAADAIEMWKFFGRRKKRAPADESVAELRDKFHLETVS